MEAASGGRRLTRRRLFILLSSLQALLLLLLQSGAPIARVAAQSETAPRQPGWYLTRNGSELGGAGWAKRAAQPTTSGSLNPAYLVSPVSQRLLQVGLQATAGDQVLELSAPHLLDGHCLNLRTSVQVTREQLHPLTGLPVRKCRGWAPLNRCEGACSSYTAPAALAPAHLRQDCLCCSEGALRSVQVRLSECYATTGADANLRLLQVPLDPLELTYMDVELSEPVQCKCRQCRPLLRRR